MFFIIWYIKNSLINSFKHNLRALNVPLLDIPIHRLEIRVLDSQLYELSV